MTVRQKSILELKDKATGTGEEGVTIRAGVSDRKRFSEEVSELITGSVKEGARKTF